MLLISREESFPLIFYGRMTLQKELFLQFVRFCIVGVFATALHYGIYLLLMHDMNASIAYTIGYVLSFVANFFLTSYFTFKKKATVKRGVGFGLSHGINYLLHIVLLNVFLWMGLSKAFSPIPVFCIVIPVNFMLVRYVFKK